jgi:ferredoxin
LTGAIKNQFGCIPGILKGEFHVKLPEVDDFARMLVDLNLLLRPRLYVMDGIMAMEGNGPRSGKPRKIGVLIFSTDPVALDATVCRLVNLRPEEIPTLKYGQEMGLGTYQNIEVVGDSLASLIRPDFNTGRPLAFSFKNPWIRNQIVSRPQINENRCVKCGICVQMCPVKPAVVNWHNDDKTNPPVYDYNRCIRCYCCQELCPEGAINLNTPWLGRALSPLRS